MPEMTPAGYAAAQLRRIEMLLVERSERLDLTEAASGIDTAGLVKLALDCRERAAAEGWAYATTVERDAARERAEWAAYLDSRAPAGAVRITVEGAHVGTGNGTAYIISRHGVEMESDPERRWTLEAFLWGHLAQMVVACLADAAEAEGRAGMAGSAG